MGGRGGKISVINNSLQSCHFAQMSEARKAFLKGLAGKKKQEEKKSESKSLVPAKALNQSTTPPKEEGGQRGSKGSNERMHFFAMLSRKRPKKDPEAVETVVQAEPGPSQQATCVVFDLSSLHEFESRNLLNRDGDTKTERKRPNYDNRLRRLNMKHSARMAYLSFDLTRFFDYH